MPSFPFPLESVVAAVVLPYHLPHSVLLIMTTDTSTMRLFALSGCIEFSVPDYSSHHAKVSASSSLPLMQ